MPVDCIGEIRFTGFFADCMYMYLYNTLESIIGNKIFEEAFIARSVIMTNTVFVSGSVFLYEIH